MKTVLGIAGASCSGKGTVARILASKFSAQLFNLDQYWIKGSYKPLINGYPSFERTEQYDGAAMARDIISFQNSNPQVPVIAEGFLLYTYPQLLQVCSTRIFLEVSQTTIQIRRSQRALKMGNSLSEGGRIAEVESAWLANGMEEWLICGAAQRDKPDVISIKANGLPEEVATLVEQRWILTNISG